MADHNTFISGGIDVDKLMAHAASLGVLLGWVAGALPALATIAALVWYAVQIYESDTFQRHVLRRRVDKDDPLE